MTLSEATTELQPPTLVEHTAFTVVGIETRTSNPREANPATARIPALWQRFTGEQIADQIPKRTNPAYALAVYSGYEGGTDGAFSLLVGAASSATAAPAGMSTARVPSGQYLMFAAEGELSSLSAGLYCRLRAPPVGHAVPAGGFYRCPLNRLSVLTRPGRQAKEQG